MELVRFIISPDRTIGYIILPNKVKLLTLERPSVSNRENTDCIPCGEYICKRVVSPKFGETFEVTGVPNRTHILFHKGNSPTDTNGCILVGMRKGGANILESSLAFENFINALDGINEFELRIVEA